MPSCPFCEHYSVTEEELERHIIQSHPDQNESLGSVMEKALSTQGIPIIASHLVDACLRHERSPQEVVSLYWQLSALLQGYEVNNTAN